MINYSLVKRTSNLVEVNAAKQRIAAATAKGQTAAAADTAIVNNPQEKYYGVAQVSQVLDLDRFASHVASHGSKYHKGDISVVLTEAVTCLRELMLDGKKVQLGDLGSFAAAISTEGTDAAADFSSKNITDVHVNWTPGTKFSDLLQDAEFEMVLKRSHQAILRKAEKAGSDVTLSDAERSQIAELRQMLTVLEQKAGGTSTPTTPSDATPSVNPDDDSFEM